ncbi:hypothetical protein [Acetivibrio clariflavus]|uniref:Uncharacterized protein n=1 Tax=Acetivibrio clariflavus (strain DSM 19732 / NBRC 101661 / EBR45) TaxID=720554 RepID=G8LT23_ACECE|nr:hypothetical protein [Acetivibrio clariflavus]AEV67227.1 hypothetical protein Clocl_0510 [Acetivibrio clariflavus DSM 19732]
MNQDMLAEIKKKETHFWEFWRKFFRGEVNEESLVDEVTQPFWQSTHISKKRLDQKGLLLDLSIYDDGIRGPIDTKSDGSNIIGNSSRNVIAERKIYRDGKLIYRKKDKEISHMHFLKSKIIEDKAKCPNCGHLGRIATFIDGCDYCGSKYVVKDFETKVSGFTLEENTYKKSKSTFFKGLLTLGIVTVLIIALGITSFIILIELLQAGNNGMEAITALLPGMFAFTYVPPLIKSLIILLIIFVFFGMALYLLYMRNIFGEEIVKAVIPNFSAYDFYQNLEYMLRSIHMADDGRQVSSFATFDLGNLVSNYQDIIDCNITRMSFLNAGKNGSRYVIDAMVTLRLLWYDGKRVKDRYEKVKCRLLGTDAILKNYYFALREYKCPNCGGSINIFEGAVCKYCTTELDYSKIGWILSDYQIIKKNYNIYRNIKVAMLAIYIAVLGFQFGMATITNNTFYEVYQITHYSDQIRDIVFKMFPLPEQMEPSLKHISYIDEYMKQLYIYEATWDTCIAYRDYLKKYGFELLSEVEGSSIILYKTFTAKDVEEQALKETQTGQLVDAIRIYFADEEGPMYVQIALEKGMMQVTISVDEI